MLIAWTTLPTKAAADALAASVVAEGLAVCVQVDGPISSHYRWQGRLECSTEFRLCLKFLPRQLPTLSAHVLRHHPYDTPEWLVVRAEDVGEKYLSWAEANSSTPPL